MYKLHYEDGSVKNIQTRVYEDAIDLAYRMLQERTNSELELGLVHYNRVVRWLDPSYNNCWVLGYYDHEKARVGILSGRNHR